MSKIRLKQILAQFGIKILCKAESNPIKQIIVKNLNRENIGKSATIADKIRITMTNLIKNKIDPQNIVLLIRFKLLILRGTSLSGKVMEMPQQGVRHKKTK